MPVVAEKNMFSSYAVIFDMDGVIADTNPYHAKAFEVFFEKYNIPTSAQEFKDHMYGKHNSHIMNYFFKRPIHGAELLALENEKESLFREIYSADVSSIAHYIPFLENLKAYGFKTGVATSAPRANMDLILDRLDIRQHYESFMASEDVQLHKPHPEVYLKSAEQLHIPTSQCIVFEDSFSGITAGLQAGMKVVAVLSSHKKEELPPCSAYIQDYQDINVQMLMDILKD